MDQALVSTLSKIKQLKGSKKFYVKEYICVPGNNDRNPKGNYGGMEHTSKYKFGRCGKAVLYSISHALGKYINIIMNRR